MENLLLRFVYDRKKQASETKKGLLQIEVRRLNSSKRVMISTGIRVCLGTGRQEDHPKPAGKNR